MSISIMNLVFKASMRDLNYQTPGGKYKKITTAVAKFVLVALARYTNDDGEGAWPSLTTLENETGLSRMSLCNALVALEQNKLISSNGWSKYHTRSYNIVVGEIKSLKTIKPDLTPDVKPGGTDVKPDLTPIKPGLTPLLNQVYEPIKPGLPDPSFNHPIKQIKEEVVVKEREEKTEISSPSPYFAATASLFCSNTPLNQPVDAVFVKLEDPVCNMTHDERFMGDDFGKLAGFVESLLMVVGTPYIFRSPEEGEYQDQCRFFSQHMLITHQGVEKLRSVFNNDSTSVDYDLLEKCFCHRAWICFEFGENLCDLGPLLELYQSGRVDEIIIKQAGAYRRTKAVEVVHIVMDRLPSKSLWPKIYHILEAEPGYLPTNPYLEIKVLQYCHEIWVSRSSKKDALTWLFEMWTPCKILGIKDDVVEDIFRQLYQERCREVNQWEQQQIIKLESIQVDPGPGIAVPELAGSFAYAGG